jgi:hypothetical protein
MERAWPEVVSQLTPLNVFLKETKDYIDQGVLRYGDDSIDFADYLDEEVWDDDGRGWDADISPGSHWTGPPEKEKPQPSQGGLMGATSSKPRQSGILEKASVLAQQSARQRSLTSTTNSKSRQNNILEKVIPKESDLQPKREGVSAAKQAETETKKRQAPGRTWLGLLGRVIRYIANPAYGFFELGVFMDSKQKGYRLMRRLAKEDARTCPDCRKYDDMGWQPIGSLPMPGRGCRCYDNCRCRIEYR